MEAKKLFEFVGLSDPPKLPREYILASIFHVF